MCRNSVSFAQDMIVKFDGTEREDIRENYLYNLEKYSKEAAELEVIIKNLLDQVPMGEKNNNKKDSQ
ncbi:hypothetical protein D3C86_2112510 [compost metagenome]